MISVRLGQGSARISCRSPGQWRIRGSGDCRMARLECVSRDVLTYGLQSDYGDVNLENHLKPVKSVPHNRSFIPFNGGQIGVVITERRFSTLRRLNTSSYTLELFVYLTYLCSYFYLCMFCLKT